MYSCAVVHILNKLCEHEFSDSRRNVNLYQTNCELPCIISPFRALYASSGYLDSFYAHSTDQITVRLVVCNKLDVSEKQL